MTVDARGAEVATTEGPVADSDDFVAGFWIIEAPSVEAARHVAVAPSRACNRRVEVRPLLGLAD